MFTVLWSVHLVRRPTISILWSTYWQFQEWGEKTPTGQEGPNSDWGGKDSNIHILPPKILVDVWSTWPGPTLAWQVGRDWPQSNNSCLMEEFCPPAGAKVGPPKEGRCPQYPAGKGNSMEGTFQAWLSPVIQWLKPKYFLSAIDWGEDLPREQ